HDRPAADTVERFLERHEIGESLGGMELVGESVVDRNAGVLREYLDGFLAVASKLDRIEHPAENAGGVLYALLDAEMNVVGREENGVAAFFGKGGLERAARSVRAFFENEGDILAGKAPGHGSRFSLAFHLVRKIEQMSDLIV